MIQLGTLLKINLLLLPWPIVGNVVLLDLLRDMVRLGEICSPVAARGRTISEADQQRLEMVYALFPREVPSKANDGDQNQDEVEYPVCE